MSFNARWGGVRIVGPLDPNREEELIGGLKNAMERGQNLEQAKQSFANAGYGIQEVEAAVKKIGIVSREMVSNYPSSPTPQVNKTKMLPTQGRQASQKKLIVILVIVISVLVLLGAAFLGKFWDKIFA
jgi:uncharacterized membrane protein